MSPRMGKFSVTTLFLVLCLCVMMVSAKSVETSVRSKRTTTPGNNCESVRQFFRQPGNVSIATPPKIKGSVCGGECCGDKAEDFFRKQGQKDFATLLRHNSRSLQGLLSFTAATLQNHVSELSRQSENKTLLLFSQVYKGMAVLSRDPIGKLYSDIRSYILVNTSQADLSSNPIDIKTSVSQFFTDFFPLVYHHILLNTASKDFAPDYKSCLKKTTETILPFGDIPKQIAQSLSKSLEATRLLLQAFRIGIEVLNTTDRLLVDESGKNNAECHEALLRMTHCPKCLGLVKHTKPCSGYCLNVLRGCLTKYVAELDSPWNGYVEGIESLVNAMKKSNEAGVNADLVIKSLDTKISEAIMRAMEKGQDIDTKVKRNCGPATFSPKKDPFWVESSTPLPSGSKMRSVNPRVFASLPESDLVHFLTSIAKTRGFYGNLADTLCQDESFAEPKDQRCWNGERIAEYTKTVVDVGLDMQKYNPEVKPLTNLQNVDPRVADLVDKLRHVHHMAMSSIGSSGADVDYMQRDGVDGSGSGNGADFDDNDDDGTRGSGSGNGAIPEEEGGGRGNNIKPLYPTGSSNRNPTTSPTGGSTSIKSSMLISFALLVLSRLY